MSDSPTWNARFGRQGKRRDMPEGEIRVLAPDPDARVGKTPQVIETSDGADPGSAGRQLRQDGQGAGCESSQQLDRTMAAIAVWTPGGLATATASSSRNGLQRPEFVPADHHGIGRRVAIQSHDPVFFTSQSGSLL